MRPPKVLRATKRHAGFTLVELLLLIGIVILLLALMLPAVQSVRESSRAFDCTTNLGAIGRAIENHKAVHAGNMVGPNGWQTTLAGYLELDAMSGPTGLATARVFTCPSNASQTSISYGFNERTHQMGIRDSGKIVALDYNALVVRSVTMPAGWVDDYAPRHFGMSNVLFYDGRVQRLEPDVIDPQKCRILLDYWVPTRDERYLGTIDCVSLEVGGGEVVIDTDSLPPAPPAPPTGPGTGDDGLPGTGDPCDDLPQSPDPPITISLTVTPDPVTVNEADTPVAITAKLDRLAPYAVRLFVETADPASGAAATAGADYVALNNYQVTIPQGNITATFHVQVKNDDETGEPPESFLVRLAGTPVIETPVGGPKPCEGLVNVSSESEESYVTVTIVDDDPNAQPIAEGDAYEVNEDQTLVVNAPGVLSNDSDGGDGGALSAVLIAAPSHAQAFALDPNGSFTYTPNADYAGIDTFTYKANDTFGYSDEVEVIITVHQVNDEPTFSASDPPVVAPDSGNQSVAGWVTSFTPDATAPGDSSESDQTVQYSVSNVGTPGLFAAGGEPYVDESGTLTYTPAAGQTGSSTFDVTVTDSGGTANGGDDTSQPQSFLITVATSDCCLANIVIDSVTIQVDGSVECRADQMSYCNFSIYEAGQEWGEYAVNWGNMPNKWAEPMTELSEVCCRCFWHTSTSFNEAGKQLIKDWLTCAKPNTGLLIREPPGTDRGGEMRTRQAGFAPRMHITIGGVTQTLYAIEDTMIEARCPGCNYGGHGEVELDDGRGGQWGLIKWDMADFSWP